MTRLLSTTEAAERLAISRRTLEGMRLKGGGPEFRKLGKRLVRYDSADLERWASRRRSTSDSGRSARP